MVTVLHDPSGSDVIGLDDDRALDLGQVGGKAVGLAALRRLDGVRVPDGFVIGTAAFRRAVDEHGSVPAHLPADLVAEIEAALDALGGAAGPWAVRSSATAEDLADASFAGQQDSFLGVRGLDAAVTAVLGCWASLFGDRAVAYRASHGIDEGALAMGVVVQRQVDALAAGVAFTAHPVTGDRRDVVIEAVAGLAEAFVAGHDAAVTYRVRAGEIVDQATGSALLDDAQVLDLAALARRVADAFGAPLDLEWCLDVDGFALVQARPITTLFPIPDVQDDEQHVYLSVGHQQMMTDPLRPLGLSVRQLASLAPMVVAGGRQFVDVGARLAIPPARTAILDMMRRSDPLMFDALATVVVEADPAWAPSEEPTPFPMPVVVGDGPVLIASLVEEADRQVARVTDAVGTASGPAVFDAILAAIEDLKAWLTAPDNHRAIMAGMEASWWLNDHVGAWLGEPDLADTLTLSAPGNVTSEMGLALVDVADVVRPHPAVVEYLEAVAADSALGESFLDGLASVPGGPEVAAAFRGFLDRYGMRCLGEIDLTRPRWSDAPSALVPALLSDVVHLAPGEAARRFDEGRRRAEAKAAQVLAEVAAGPDGAARAAATATMIEQVRTFIGYREFPKYVIVRHYAVYREALRREAAALVTAGVLDRVDDADFLTFDELRDAVVLRVADPALIERWRAEFAWFESLVLPRVLTSDGVALSGRYRRDGVPDGALLGLGVSSGVVEGRARVVTDLGAGDLEPGDILVTAHTDPSWSPVFVAIAGLVTEVGGLMTHGAVVAREYGLPAVVSVDGATRTIRDGQRIRVDGSAGIVEILDEGGDEGRSGGRDQAAGSRRTSSPTVIAM
jgi:pyruvate,water dikinase